MDARLSLRGDESLRQPLCVFIIVVVHTHTSGDGMMTVVRLEVPMDNVCMLSVLASPAMDVLRGEQRQTKDAENSATRDESPAPKALHYDRIISGGACPSQCICSGRQF